MSARLVLLATIASLALAPSSEPFHHHHEQLNDEQPNDEQANDEQPNDEQPNDEQPNDEQANDEQANDEQPIKIEQANDEDNDEEMADDTDVFDCIGLYILALNPCTYFFLISVYTQIRASAKKCGHVEEGFDGRD